MIGNELGPGDGNRLFKALNHNFGATVKVWGISGSKDRVSKVDLWTGSLEECTILAISHDGERVRGCTDFFRFLSCYPCNFAEEILIRLCGKWHTD